jgi:hypothetical protein
MIEYSMDQLLNISGLIVPQSILTDLSLTLKCKKTLRKRTNGLCFKRGVRYRILGLRLGEVFMIDEHGMNFDFAIVPDGISYSIWDYFEDSQRKPKTKKEK